MQPMILQSDFGYADGAVCAMYGVAENVCPELRVFDLTHDIPQYDIWEASYRLIQTVSYWPEGSVFVSVVDPGVGSTRRSIAVRTLTGQYVITPDNGTLTHVKRICGIAEARVIDESVNRLPNSGESYTFHGRDIYAYTGARLASGAITFEQVGPEVPPDSVIELPVVEAAMEGDCVSGTIDVLDVRFGSLWTNIPRELFLKLGLTHGSRAEVTITNDTRTLYKKHHGVRPFLRRRQRGRAAPLRQQPRLRGRGHQPGQLFQGVQHRHRHHLAHYAAQGSAHHL